MKYCIIFEPDTDEFNCLNCPAHAIEEPGRTYCAADPHCTYIDDPLKRPEFCSVTPLPPKMPLIQYDFETYQTGYAKGFNDFRDQLTGVWNHYNPDWEDIEKNV